MAGEYGHGHWLSHGCWYARTAKRKDAGATGARALATFGWLLLPSTKYKRGGLGGLTVRYFGACRHFYSTHDGPVYANYHAFIALPLFPPSKARAKCPCWAARPADAICWARRRLLRHSRRFSTIGLWVKQSKANSRPDSECSAGGTWAGWTTNRWDFTSAQIAIDQERCWILGSTDFGARLPLHG